jgi:hypothetical protein
VFTFKKKLCCDYALFVRGHTLGEELYFSKKKWLTKQMNVCNNAEQEPGGHHSTSHFFVSLSAVSADDPQRL